MGHCTWANMNEANKIYHDTEWGIPVHDDRQMFEHLTLECMQCGLSWDLMLKKREIFRKCFDDFDYDKIAFYDDENIEHILNTEGMTHLQACGIINDHDKDCPCYMRIVREYPIVRMDRDSEVW